MPVIYEDTEFLSPESKLENNETAGERKNETTAGMTTQEHAVKDFTDFENP